MFADKNFLHFTSVCCFLTVVTTLGIHLFFPDPPTDFEERIQLFRNQTYLINRWWIIVHCLLVIISMWGFALIQIKKAPGFTGLGFLFFAVFAIAEITRQMFVLFYVNGLREQYYSAADINIREVLKNTLLNAGLITAPLFGVFILSFGLGNLFYGLSLTGEKGYGKILAMLLILWSLGTFVALGNNFWKVPAIDIIIEKYNFTYQPLMRLLLAIWIWKNSVQRSS